MTHTERENKLARLRAELAAWTAKDCRDARGYEAYMACLAGVEAKRSVLAAEIRTLLETEPDAP